METVTLFIERKLSDGNYGSQGFSLGLTIPFDPKHDDLDEIVKSQHEALLGMVLERLAASPNGRVSYTAQRELHADEEHERAEAWAMSNASSEERAIRAMDDEEAMPF